MSLDTDSWIDHLLEKAWYYRIPKEKKALAIYAASNMKAERESWTWKQAHQPRFEIHPVMPCFNVSFDPSQSTACCANFISLEERLALKVMGLLWVIHVRS